MMHNDIPIGFTIAENAAAKLINKYGISSPEHIRLKDIAFNEKVLVIEEPVARASASLVRTGNRGTIRVSPSETIERRRFSIAHELGHFMLNHIEGSIQKVCSKQDMMSWYKPSIETEANYFASELVLPTELVEPLCDVKEVNFNPVRKISKIFRASLTATAIKFVRLNPEKCALVYSEAGKIVWSCQSPDWWPFIKKGCSIDKRTDAYDFFQGKELWDEPFELEAGAWLDNPKGIKELVEHSIGSKYFDFVLSLLWIEP